jgi:hypothetical protein
METMDKQSWLEALKRGIPLDSATFLDYVTIGRYIWLDFVIKRYLEDYILHGGSKIKLLVGSEGTGKTHQIYCLGQAARIRGYLVVHLNAPSIPKIQYLHHLYSEILQALPVEDIVRKYCTTQILKPLGYTPEHMVPEQSFYQWVTDERGEGRVPEMIRRDVKREMDKLLRNRRIDNLFATAFMSLCLNHLGVHRLGEDEKERVFRWMRAEKLTLRDLRPLYLYARIDRYSARNMLKSLLEVIALAGFSGLVVTMDSLEVLVNRDPEKEHFVYTRVARDDFYEVIRQIIDEADTLKNFLFILAARKELLSDTRRGIKSYDALWMRIQNEVVSDHFNRFADIVDLDFSMRVLEKREWEDLSSRITSLCKELGIGGEQSIGDILLSEITQEKHVPIRRFVSLAAGQAILPERIYP